MRKEVIPMEFVYLIAAICNIVKFAYESFEAVCKTVRRKMGK